MKLDDRLVDAHRHWITALSSSKVPSAICTTCIEEFDQVRSHKAAAANNNLLGLGLHPQHQIVEPTNTLFKVFDKRIQNADFIGEIGLDFRNLEIDRMKQVERFSLALDSTSTFSQTVSVHCVKAWASLIECLRPYAKGSFKLHFHAFSGSLEIAKQLVRKFGLDVFISFQPSQLQYNRKRTLTVVKSLPASQIMVESDASNETQWTVDSYKAYLAEGYNRLSSIRQIPSGELAPQLNDNFTRCFRA